MAHAPTKDIVILNFIFPALLLRLDKLFCKGITLQFRASPKKQVQTCTKLKKARFQYITVHIKADVYYSFLDFPDIWFDFHFRFRDVNNVASCLGMQLNKA